MFDHLQIYDRRERLAVGVLDAALTVLSGAGRVLALDATLARRREADVTPRRILLLRLERIGDLLMTLDAIAAVRALAPHAEIDLVVGSWNADVARAIPHVDRVLTLDAPWLAREGDGRSWLALFRQAGADWAPRAYDVAINFEGDVRSHLLMTRSRAPVRIGFDMAGGGPLLTHRVRFDPSRHTAENALALVAHAAPSLVPGARAGVVPAAPSLRPTLLLGPEAVSRAEGRLAAAGSSSVPSSACTPAGDARSSSGPPSGSARPWVGSPAKPAPPCS